MKSLSCLTLLVLLLSCPLGAQGRSHGYVSLGAGATDLNGGLDWLIAGGPIGIGGDVGFGWVYQSAITGSYHYPVHRPVKYDVFATGGYSVLGNDEFSSHGVRVGGGTTYWLASHLALRFDAFKYLPVATDHNISAAQRSPSRYWGARAGVAFRFR